MRKFIKEIIKDFIPAYKQLIRKVMGGKSPPEPFQPGRLSLPGGYPRGKMLDIVMGVSLYGGIIIGLLLGMGFIIIAALLFGRFDIQWFFLAAVPFFLLLPVIYYQLKKFALGYDGELVVAEALGECFRKKDWRLFHSLEIPRHTGDIDHVVVCPKGVFCVEAKARRWAKDKKITVQGNEIMLNDMKIYGNPIPRTKAAAAALNSFLKEQCSFDVPFVVPVVLFADDDDDYYFSDKLIVGKSGGIKHIFREFSDKADVLDREQIDKIGAALGAQNRKIKD